MVSLFFSPLVVLLLLRDLIWLRLNKLARPRGEVWFSYSQVMWDEVWQRPQEFAFRAGRERPVIYMAPVQVHRWLFTLKKRWAPIQFKEDGRTVIVLSPLIFSGHYKSGIVFALNSLVLAAHGRAWLAQAERLRVVVNTPFAAQVIDHLFGQSGERDSRVKALMFDLIDDFAAFDWAPRSGRAMEKRLLKQADVVITGTYELLEHVRPQRPDAEFIPCGVDYDLFYVPAGIPADMKEIRRPCIGYFGSISERIDGALISRLAREFPEASVVMTGPVHLAAGDVPRADNIFYPGLKPHAELPGYAQQFDVGLIPFRITPATLKLNPVKTLEYLAAGVPVVSTAIPDVIRFFGEVVRVANDHDAFVSEVRSALESDNRSRREAGFKLARSASWQAMADRMSALLQGTTSKGDPV